VEGPVADPAFEPVVGNLVSVLPSCRILRSIPEWIGA